MLEALIADYKKAQAAWALKFEEDDSEENTRFEWRAYSDAGWTLMGYRCANLDEISRKAEFISSDENLIDMLASCQTDDAVKALLASMIKPLRESQPGTPLLWHPV
jgi:hypothetical protein